MPSLSMTSHVREGLGDGPRKFDMSTTPPHQGFIHQHTPTTMSQPIGLPHYTHGITGHHILSVSSFRKEQVYMSITHLILQRKLVKILCCRFN